MAEGKIRYEDLFDNDLMAQLAKLKAEIESVKSNISGLKGNLPKSGNQAGDVEKLNAVQKERIKLQEKLDALNDKEVKANIELKQQIQQRLQEQKNEIKLNQAKEGSMDKISQNLRKLKREYRELSESERKNVNVGGKLLKQIQQQDKEIKDLDKSLGDHQRNVGNYTGGIKQAAGEMGLFGGKLGRASQMFGGLKTGLKTARAGFISLKAAIISTGIGALVIALTSLFQYFTSTTKGARMLSSIMAGIGGVVDVLVDKLSSLGESLVNVVQNPLKYFSILKDYITDRIVPIFGSLGKIIKNAVTFNWSELGANVDEFSENFTKVQDDWKQMAEENTKAFKDMFSTMADAYTENKKLQEDRDKLKDAERELGVELARNKKEYQDLLLISRDEINTFDQRQAALKRANEIELQNLENSTRLAEEKLRIAREQAAWNTKNGRTQEADLEAIAEAETALFEMQAQNAARRREITNRQIELNNKETSAKKADAKFEADFQKELEQELLDLEKDINDEILSETDETNKELVEQLTKRLEEEGKLKGEALNEEEQRQKRLADLYKSTAEIVGEQLGITLADSEATFKEFGKNMLLLMLDILEKQTILAMAGATATEASSKPFPANLFTTALKIVAIKTAFAFAKTAISQFEKGEVDIQGRRHSQGGILAEFEGGESVINRTGTANARETLQLINDGKLGDAHIMPMLAMSAARVPAIAIDNDFSKVVSEQKETNKLLKKFKFMSGDGRKVMDIHGNIINYV